MNKEEQKAELLKAAKLLQEVEVNGRFWLQMMAIYNSITIVANELTGEIQQAQEVETKTIAERQLKGKRVNGGFNRTAEGSDS